jgi:hypothetical protein
MQHARSHTTSVTHSRRPSALGKNRATCEQMVRFLPTMKSRDLDTAVQAFRHKGGTLRTRDLIAQGGPYRRPLCSS